MLFNNNFSKAVFKTAFFIFIGLILCACNKAPDEQQIEKIITEMITAIEQGKSADITDNLHKNFIANGRMDSKEIARLLMLYNLQHANISITRVSSKTRIDPVYTDKAETVLSVIVTGASAGARLPNDGSLRTVKLEWRKDGDWKLLAANWEN